MMRTIRPRFVAFFLAGVAVAAPTVMACGSDSKVFEEDKTTPSFVDEGGAPDAADASSCLSQTIAAEPLSLSMLILADRSSSMKGPSWTAATAAMISFADGASAVGTELGLSVFPPDAPSTQSCTLTSFAPIVPIGPLPANSSVIKSALQARSPDGDTPMGIAVRAGHRAMQAHVQATPRTEGVLILVTDGLPTSCGSTSAEVELEVRAAAAESPPIRTFVVGMDGANFATLDTFAAAGLGTTKAFNATSASGDVQGAIVAALEAARDTTLGCEFVLPVPSSELGTLDRESVELAIRTSTGATPKAIHKVADATACGVGSDGFYYDDPASPQRIILCPTSCNTVKTTGAGASVDIHLGCIRQVQ